MPRYYGTDPTEYYRNSYFDPLTGRLRGGQMVMDFLNRIAEGKRKKKEEAWELEDRELRKKLTEAQIANYYEKPEPKVPAQKGYQLPPSVKKQIAQYHGFKDETEYDQYDTQFQQDMAKEYFDAKSEAQRLGLKGNPNKSAVAKAKSIENIAKGLDARAVDLRGQINSLTMNPQSDPTGEGKKAINKALENIRRVQWRMLRISRMVDEQGNIPKQYEDEIAAYLNSPSGIETGEIFTPQKSAMPEKIVEETIPPNVLAAARQKRPDLSDEEIIKLWRANRKK